MRNLKLKYLRTHTTPVVDPKIVVLDPNTSNKDTVFICTGSTLHSFDIQTGESSLLFEVPGIVSGEFLSLENEICLATETGEVLLINPVTKVSSEVTFCADGIEQMVWSPDQEVVAFITKTRNLVVMTCTFEPIADASLDEESFGENAFINVGWGKKETQFHGSEGKTAATKKPTFNAPENLSELPQGIDITWRADGSFFAVSYVGSQGRMFKVFNKEGVLKYTSERTSDLWPAIAWRPSGTWIAVPQKFPNKSTIALFEKNGLRHREIVLPFAFDDEQVVNLKWSSDSDILSIETVLNGKSNLYLYTINNYHWYLKQTLSFDGILSSYVWSNRIGEEKSMYVTLPDGTLAYYTWIYSINRYHASGDTGDPSDYRLKSALVGVIDGKHLLVTNFRKGIVPPPMSSWQIECDSYVNSCAFLTGQSQREKFVSLFVYTHQNELLLYAILGDNDVKFVRRTLIAKSLVPLSHHNFVALGESTACWIQSDNCSSILWRIQGENSQLASVKIKETVCCLEGITDRRLVIYSIDGKLFTCSSDSIERFEKNSFNLVSGCERLEQFTRNGQSGYVSLDNRQNLRLNTKVVATDVTSFHITTNYIVATTLAVMKFLRLDDGQLINERKIERGAKIVMILPHGSTTILQLPRGNLEVIHPRVLCLELVGELLDRKEYFLAMDLARRQRINLNIICDHDIGQFLQHIKRFIFAVSPQWLNLFLTDLQNSDFTQTMYSSNYPASARVYPEGFCISSKVMQICEKLCKEMEDNDFHKFMLPIITAQVKVGNLEKALQIIWQEKRKEAASAASGDERSRADDALKYLLYLVDVNQLYDEALGMYDFGLVLMVAKKSQKDPREFLQFLNELKVLEENYMKYKIDLHLKRYTKALANISRCGENRFQEAMELVKTHNLYKEALLAYQGNSGCFKKIAHAYGDHLRENGKLGNASVMYERAGDVVQAVACARHVLDWQRCVALTKKDGVYPQNVAVICSSLVPSLMEHGKYEDAFELLRRYGDSFSDGIACLLKGNLYLRAIYEVKMENSDLLNSLLLPHLLKYKESFEANLNADRELFVKHRDRLLAIREKKAKTALVDDPDDEVQIDESDLLSDTTSMHSSRFTGSSRGTGKTFRSSKNRRKHERKILSLKEGNPFEDIALIDALHNHVVKVYALQSHVHDTCKALIETMQDTHARQIQHQYKALLQLIRDSLDEIWTPEIMTTAQYVTGPNIDYAALQNEQRYAMINPLKRFKPQLNLLDWEHEILR